MHALPITNSDIVYYNLGTNSLLDISYFVDFIEIKKKKSIIFGKIGKIKVKPQTLQANNITIPYK